MMPKECLLRSPISQPSVKRSVGALSRTAEAGIGANSPGTRADLLLPCTHRPMIARRALIARSLTVFVWAGRGECRETRLGL